MMWSNLSALGGRAGWSQSLVWGMIFKFEHSGQWWCQNETRRLEEKEEEGKPRTLIWIKLVMRWIDKGGDLRSGWNYINSLPLSLMAWWQKPALRFHYLPSFSFHPPIFSFSNHPSRNDLEFTYAEVKMNIQVNLHILEFHLREIYSGEKDYLISNILWKGL